MRLTRRDLLKLGGTALTATAVAPSLARAQTPRRGGTVTLRTWDPRGTSGPVARLRLWL